MLQSQNILRAKMIAAAIAAVSTSTMAAEIPWIGGAPGDTTNFNNASNWQGGNLPVIYNEVTNTTNGDVAVFDGAQAGLANKTPTMTAAFGTGVGGGSAGSSSETWGLQGVRLIDSGWTIDTGANTLYLSHRGTYDLRSEAIAGTNTLNGNLRLGARDTNDFPVIYQAAGGTLRINATVGIAIDGGGNASGGPEVRGGGLVELNTTGGWGNTGLRVFEGSTVRFFAETAGGFTGTGQGGLASDTRTLLISNGTVDLNGARPSLIFGTLSLPAAGTLTNSSANAEAVDIRPTGAQTLAGLISGNLSMSFGAAPSTGVVVTTTLTNNNTYTGGTAILNGTTGGSTNSIVVTQSVLAGQNGPLGNNSTAISIGSTGSSSNHAQLLTSGAIDIGRDITFVAGTHASSVKTLGAAATQVGNSVFSGDITVGTGTGGAKLSVTAPAGVSVSFTGDILEDLVSPANGVLTKIGDGTVVLSGNNTYAGGTTVSLGTLLVNNLVGSGTGGGGATVTENATIGGFGSIAGNVLLGADSADLDALGGIIMPTSSSNPLDIVGNLTADAGAAIDLQMMTGLNPLTTYTVVTYASLGGSLAVLNQPVTHSVDFGTGSIQLVPVPEPTAIALIGLALIPVLRRRSR